MLRTSLFLGLSNEIQFLLFSLTFHAMKMYTPVTCISIWTDENGWKSSFSLSIDRFSNGLKQE